MPGLKQLHAPLAWVNGGWQRDVLLSVDGDRPLGRDHRQPARRRPMRRAAGRAGHPQPGQRAQPRLPARLRRPGRAARGRAGRLLELARPHVRAGAAHLAAATARRGQPALCRAAARRLHPGLRVPLPAPPGRRPGTSRTSWTWPGRWPSAARGHRHRLDAAAGGLHPQRLCRSNGLRPDQHRFAADADWAWRACQRINAAGLPRVNAGCRAAFAARRVAGRTSSPAAARWWAATDLPHAHPRRRADGRGGRLPGRPPAMRPLQWLAEQRPPGHALAAGACHACFEPAEIEAVAAQRRRHRHLPWHRGQPG